jgi:hypothetical protein
MKDSKAIEILRQLLDKYSLTEEEREAIRAALGILAWTKLSESRLENLKKKKGI